MYLELMPVDVKLGYKEFDIKYDNTLKAIVCDWTNPSPPHNWQLMLYRSSHEGNVHSEKILFLLKGLSIKDNGKYLSLFFNTTHLCLYTGKIGVMRHVY